MREFLFSRLVTQLFLGCVVGCLFFNIAMEPPAAPPAVPVPKASEADTAKAKEILAAAVDAHGGLEKLQAVKNIVIVPQPTTRILKLFVSQETHYIVKLIHRETTEEGVTADRETFMDDYRDVEGIKVAHHIVQKIEDQVLSDSRVTRVILNAEEIDASVFQKPE